MLVFQATIGKKLTPEEIAAAVKSKPVGIHLQASERWISTANNMNELSKALNAAAKQKNLPNETKTALNKALDYAAKVHEQIERMVPKTAETVSGTEFLPAREIKKL